MSRETVEYSKRFNQYKVRFEHDGDSYAFLTDPDTFEAMLHPHNETLVTVVRIEAA